MNVFRRFIKGIRIVPEATDPVETDDGNISVNSTGTPKIKVVLGGVLQEIVTGTQSQSVTNKNLDDSTVAFVDTVDPTKRIKFDAAGTTGTTTTLAGTQTANRTLSLPDATDTLVGKATTDVLTNKSIDATTNTISNIANANIAAAAGIVYSKLNLANSIVNADIAAGAAIAYAKLALTNSIVDADINAAAAIAYTKLALTNSIVNADINAAAAIAYSKLNLSNSIVNADINAAAAIAYSKLALTNSIVNADINAAAAIAYTKLNLTGSIVNADIAAAANIARSKINAGTANRVVVNDGAGALADSAVTTTELGRLTGILSSAVGISDTQTLTNKTFGDAATFTQIATPSNPSAGFNKLYPKSDNTFYTLDSTGNEVPVGSGSGSGGQNYIANPTFNSTANNYAAYADAANPRPVDGTGGSPTVTITRTTSSPLHGAGSGLITKDAANRQGEGVSTDITIDNGDQGKTMVLSFDYQIASGTFQAGNDATQTDSDIIAYVYRTTATGRTIEPLGFRLKGSIVGVNYSHKAYFATDPDATGYRIIFHVATTSAAAYTFKFDNLSVSTQVLNYAPLTTDETAYTPTTAGFGTVTSMNAQYARVGGRANFRITFTSGTVSATEAYVSLPAGLNFTNTSASNELVGYITIGAGTIANAYTVIADPANPDRLKFGRLSATDSGLDPRDGNEIFPSTSVISFFASVPISGWGANAVAPEQADPRLIVAEYSRNSVQTIPDTTLTIVNFDDQDRDTFASVTTGASWKFTAPITGDYRAQGFIWWAGNVTGSRDLQLYKNGSLYRYMQNESRAVSTPFGQNGEVVLHLVAGDYIDFRVQQTSGGNLNIDGATITAYCSVEKLPEPAMIPPSDVVLIKYGLSANTAVATNGTIPFDTKKIDTHGAFAAGVFTAPVGGYYRLSCMLSITTSSSHGVYMQKNGSIDEYTGTIISTVNSGVQSGVVQLDSGDTLTLKLDSAATIVGSGASPSTSNISIERIS